jgi:hypothetical protein
LRNQIGTGGGTSLGRERKKKGRIKILDFFKKEKIEAFVQD